MEILLNARSTILHHLQHLSQLKLSYLEQGHGDVWQHTYDTYDQQVADIRTALEELTMGHLKMPSWLPAAA